MSVVVVVPTHKEELSGHEVISLSQCVKVLGKHRKILVHPESVNGVRLSKRYGLDGTEAFPNECFSSYSNYNRTIRSAYFYDRFLSYEYMLLHELDAFVFSDELLGWCGREFDYVGAPLGLVSSAVKEYCACGYFPWWARYKFAYGRLDEKAFQLFNGGLSLRKTKTLHRIGRLWENKILIWGRNDDLWWSVVAPRLWPWFRLPDEHVAARFSLMIDVEEWMKKLDGRRPFGCHGWPRYEYETWKGHLSALGYQL